MQLFFVYPPKPFLLDMPRNKPRQFTHDGHDWLVFDNLEVFVNTDRGAVSCTKSEQISTYFLHMDHGVYCKAGHAAYCPNDSYFKNRLRALPKDAIHNLIDQNHIIMADMEGYARSKREEIEAKAQDRALRDAERNQREEEKRQEELSDACMQFKIGNKISWDMFEKLCKMHNIRIPATTLGSARRCVEWIKLGQMGVIGKHNPQSALHAARALHDKLNDTQREAV